ncbi:uncharacterized protein [Apostichopus japonicus]|uniref:uncharacterized protein n=1 Tax=Stichopus japonicus TaxID=307972 RepID=UPI003AB149E2
MAAKIGDISETLLLTPRGKVTLIEKKDLRRLDLRVFDRIAFHRSYMMIHEAIVLQVNGPCEIVVLERTKEDGPFSKGTVRVHKINLYAENGQLYRYDDRPTEADNPDIMKRVLEYHGTEGYNVLSYNCQHLSSSIRYGNENSHQTWWMILKIGIDFCCYLGIPLVSEKYENGNGGKDILGVKASAFLHLGLLAAECSVASIKVFRGRMSWRDFFNVMPRQLRMHILGLAGNSIQPILKNLAFYFLPTTAMASFGRVAPSCTVSLVFGFCGYLVVDAVLPGSASCTDDECYKNFRLASISAASISSFFAGFFFVTGWPLEAFVAMIGGYSVPILGNLLYTEAVSWFSKETVGGGWIQDFADLNPGDHITTYRNFIHRYSHAILLERAASNNSMVVIRNNKGRGVIQVELKFEKDWVYRYNYPSSEVRSAQEVVAVAQSKIGGKYHHDCWSFANLCKLKHTGSEERSAVSIDSIFDTIKSDEFLSEKELETYINNFDRLKKEMSNEYKVDDGTTQEHIESLSKGTFPTSEGDIVETGCAYRNNGSYNINEKLFQQGPRCLLGETERDGFICSDFLCSGESNAVSIDSISDTISSDESLVEQELEAFRNYIDRLSKEKYKEDDGTTQFCHTAKVKDALAAVERYCKTDLDNNGSIFRQEGIIFDGCLIEEIRNERDCSFCPAFFCGFGMTFVASLMVITPAAVTSISDGLLLM